MSEIVNDNSSIGNTLPRSICQELTRRFPAARDIRSLKIEFLNLELSPMD